MSQNFQEIIQKSILIRQRYHELEEKYHGRKWTLQEDVLWYLSDSGLVARNIMSEENIWPKADSREELEHKLAENIWWLIDIAHRSDIDIEQALEKFFQKTYQKIGL